ncbi:HNH endonuclease [Lysobacter sp. Root690]|uniref:HNH endonuclease n=1 Tax=Lysobacter sp. Root690 TaxID=1736588 RepID=UPI001F38C505|nr:HNH endonuclease [Lysobacter sp. Root690]
MKQAIFYFWPGRPWPPNPFNEEGAMLTLIQGSRYTSAKCIQCEKPARLTVEHVFPDGAGGCLTAHILCKVCNEHFGKNIDGPYLKQSVVELARNAYRIGGRRGVIPQPLGGPYKIAGPVGRSVIKLDTDFRPRIIPQVEDIEIMECGAISVTMVIDATDRKNIPTIVRSKFERFFKSERGLGLGWTQEEQERGILSTINKYMSAPDVETPIGVLSGTMEMKLDTVFLEAAKVAFELAAIEDGDVFINSTKAKHFRTLLGRVDKGRMESSMSFEEILKAFQAAPLPAGSQVFLGIQYLTGGKAYEHHVGILSGPHVIVSLFGYVYIFGDLRAYMGRSAIYTNNVVSGEVRYAKM